MMFVRPFLAPLALLNAAVVSQAFVCPSASVARPTMAVNGFFGGGSSSRNTDEDGYDENEDEDFMRWARASRSAQASDNVVELVRPLGLVLDQDERGNVYVKTVAPRGNAARTGKVKEGDYLTMCSATFGDEMWSTRGVGLTRVLAAIRVRSGATVKLVFESASESAAKKQMTQKEIKAQQEARIAAQKKKDALLAELEETEERLNNGKKFFGLF